MRISGDNSAHKTKAIGIPSTLFASRIMANLAIPKIPPTHRALLLNSTRDPYDISVVVRPTPQADPGSVVVRVLSAAVLTYAGEVYSGKRRYFYPEPFVPGLSAIGRVAAVGPDATLLKAGQLVVVDCYIYARDDPASRCLHGLSAGFTPSSAILLEGEWRESTYAEYCKVPLENCYPLDESRLLGGPAEGGLGHRVDDLAYMLHMTVPFGGLRDVNLGFGERVVITPAAGSFGSAAVLSALALGAQVIAMGRNPVTLESLKAFAPAGKIRTVVNTGDVDADVKELLKDGPIDVFCDISPPEAADSTHFESCIKALRRGGRVSLLGAHPKLTLPAMFIVLNDITIKGKWMYNKEDVRMMIRLLEDGYLKLGRNQTAGSFPLENFAEAFDMAAKIGGPCLQTVISP